MTRTRKGGSRRGPSPPPKRIGNPKGANGSTMSNAKLSNRLDARQNNLLDILDDTSMPTSMPTMHGLTEPEDEWAVGEGRQRSMEVRYFSPFEECHPLRYFGAEKYEGACPCQKMQESLCSFHYPNGHPSDALQNRPRCAGPSGPRWNTDCSVCGGSVDFPCLKCTSVNNKN